MKNGRLSISNLEFKYPTYGNLQGRELFTGLSADIAAGEISVIFGGAESGKSTLALITAALIPVHTGGELSGRVELDGIDVSTVEPAEFIEHCGIIFQDPERQTITTECFTEAAFALESLGIPESEIEERVGRAFSELGISRLIDSLSSETSGGEKKKLALAGLIAVNPDLWLLDDTMEEIDNPSRIALFRLLRRSGKTVIIFSSKYYEAFSEADAFFLLQDGKLSARNKYPFSGSFKESLRTAGITPDFSRSSFKSIAAGHDNSSKRLLLSAKDLSYIYEHGGFRLDVDGFDLHEDEVVSIVGRNGCGKSTLARLLCGLIEPSGGFINAGTAEGGLIKADADFLNSFCAYMFQNPDYQIFLPTVYDELSWGMKEAGYSSSVIKAAVGNTIEEFGLPGGECPPALMSFSARKRLQAGIYYLLKRRVFILDEADTGLSFNDFIDLAGKLRASCSGLIIITHNLDLASAVSDRVTGMSCGRLYNDILDFNPERLNKWLMESGDRL